MPVVQMVDLDFRGPGWKIEPRYSPKVLIGNWYEERMRTDPSFYDLKYYPHRSDLQPYRVGTANAAISQRKTSPENDNSQNNETKLSRDNGHKAEHPKISGNYGLKEEMEKKWRAQNAIRVNHGGLSSTYTVDYSEWPRRSRFYRMSAELGRSAPNLHHIANSGSSTARVRCSDPTHLHEAPQKFDSYDNSGDVTSRYSRHMIAL